MGDIERFKEFAKKSNQQVINKDGKAVIYTRVSTKEQAENNASLETQMKYCKEVASRRGIEVIQYFGGTHESAKSDNRKEFNRMLNFIKRHKDVSYVIVYSYDRFSRTGVHGANISDELKRKHGVITLSATQSVDSSTAAGTFQQNMFFMVSQFDNEQRRDKSVTGMQEKLRKGYWIGTIPFGYKNLNPGKGKVQNIVLTEEGKLLKYAFLWKAKENITNAEIVERLEKKGLVVNYKKLSDYFRNVFYCGLVASAHIPGEIIKGKHENMVSEAVFLNVQESLNKRGHGEKLNTNAVELPLKKFVKSTTCDTPLTGYLVKRKKLWYYKTNRVGAGENKSAKIMHEQFMELLGGFQISDKKYVAPAKEILLHTFKLHHEEALQESDAQIRNLNDLQKKLDRLEERFVFEEISKEQYEKFKEVLSVDLLKVTESLYKNNFNLSNLDKALDLSIEYSMQLPSLWEKGSLNTKKKIQNMVFPGGIQYNFEKGIYRTTRTNFVFDAIGSLSIGLGCKKNGNYSFKMNNSRLVPLTGQNLNHISSILILLRNLSSKNSS